MDTVLALLPVLVAPVLVVFFLLWIRRRYPNRRTNDAGGEGWSEVDGGDGGDGGGD